jgi:hypothetical protein
MARRWWITTTPSRINPMGGGNSPIGAGPGHRQSGLMGIFLATTMAVMSAWPIIAKKAAISVDRLDFALNESNVVRDGAPRT